MPKHRGARRAQPTAAPPAPVSPAVDLTPPLVIGGEPAAAAFELGGISPDRIDPVLADFAYRRARRAAALWLVGGLILAAIGAATLVHAIYHGGWVWSGAMWVGAIICFRALRSFFSMYGLRAFTRLRLY